MTMLSGWANHIELTRSTRRTFICDNLAQNASGIFNAPESTPQNNDKIISKTFTIIARKIA
jgi:hypothetical protein